MFSTVIFNEVKFDIGKIDRSVQISYTFLISLKYHKKIKELFMDMYIFSNFIFVVKWKIFEFHKYAIHIVA